ncbi:MAG TPA: hypothetical protein VHC49_18425, partial [Mycobacteriales bacterium]|nr:hypothetical protein [Mycobacteriales bacterium]
MSGDWTETLRLSVAAGRAWMRGDVARCQQILQHQRDSARKDPRAELAALTASALLGALSGRLAGARADLVAAGSRLQELGFAAFGPQWEQAALVCD